MMIESKLERAGEYDRDRCQATVAHGQCPFRAAPGLQYCKMHGANSGQEKVEAKNLRMYRAAKWRDRIGEFADDDRVKSLREEIGILRVVMEETLQMCRAPEDLLLYASRITDTVIKIEKLVTSCHRLESATGAMLDKTQALHLASVIVEIIGRHITDVGSIDSISAEIVAAIMTSRPLEK